MSDAPPQADAWSFEDAQAEWAPQRLDTQVCFDGKLVAKIDRLEDELRETANETTAVDIANVLVGLHAELERKSRTFVFQGLPRRRWSDLLAEHPPTQAQREADRRLDHNPEEFPRVAIAESCVSPTLTPEQVDWMTEHLSFGQVERLWRTCLTVNAGYDGVGKVLSSTAARLATEPSSTTAVLEESPEASSSDGS